MNLMNKAIEGGNRVSTLVQQMDQVETIRNDTKNQHKADSALRDQDTAKTDIAIHLAWKGIGIDKNNKDRQLVEKIAF